MRVAACAVCRTDLQRCEGDLPARRLPIVPGHQGVGRVEAVGTNVDGWSVGERLGIGWLASTCGTCGSCTSGRENLCPEARFSGWDVDGGFEERAIVRAGNVALQSLKASAVEGAAVLRLAPGSQPP